MIIIACQDCATAVRVTGEHEELNHLLGEMNTEWYPNKYPCPTSGCKGKAEFVEGVEPVALRAMTLYDLTPHEAFGAFHGLGFPEERDCGRTAVEKALLENRVVGVGCALVRGANRSVVYHLKLDNGVTVYFGSSPFGAVVYRIGKTESAVDRIDDAR